MPIYEYKCNSCGKKFERIEKFSDAPLQNHPECGGPVERLLSAPALQFKGTGWYVTDYARGNGSSKDGSTKEGHDAKKETSSESKTESKSDSTTPASKSADSTSSTTSTTPSPS